jgi:hypothetical protein
MKTYARGLFGLAAFANLAVAGLFLFAKAPLVALLGLDPITGTNLVFVNLAAILIAAFGYSYARIAADPARFRLLIHLGAAGKLAAVVVAAIGAAENPHAIRLAALISGDAIFAALFLDYLRRTGARPGH